MKKWLLLIAALISVNDVAAEPVTVSGETLRCQSEPLGNPDTYPHDAMRKLESGTLSIKVTTDAQGKVMDSAVFSPSGSQSLDESSRQASLNSRISCNEDIDGNEFIVTYRYTLTPQMKGAEVEAIGGSFMRVTRPIADYRRVQPVPSHCTSTRKPDGTTSLDCNHDGVCHFVGKSMQPVYPREDLINGHEGKVVVAVTIDPATGAATSFNLAQATRHKGLNEAALNAVKSQKFRCFGKNPNVIQEIRYEFTSVR